MARRRGLEPTPHPVDQGTATLVPDPDRPRAFTLAVDGAPQSHVDLDDPTSLEFEYVRRMADVLDLVAPPGVPLRVLHLGGGALTLPRYLAVTRPGSSQRVVEVDAALVELVRRELPWPRGVPAPRVRVGDARAAVEGAVAESYDAVVGDVFSGARTPAHLTSTEYVRAVARVLRPGGFYLLNVADGGALGFARAQAATLRSVFPAVCLVAESSVLRGRRFGNLVGVAGDGPLPVRDLVRVNAGAAFPARVVVGADLDRFVAGARPVTDAVATHSPQPPRSALTG